MPHHDMAMAVPDSLVLGKSSERIRQEETPNRSSQRRRGNFSETIQIFGRDIDPRRQSLARMDAEL